MKKFAAVAALALGLTLSACSTQAPEQPAAAPTSSPSVSATVKPSEAPQVAETPAPTPTVAPEVAPVEMPAVEPVAPPVVHVEPQDYATDAPEWVEPVVQAPVVAQQPYVAPVAPVNPAPGAQTIPVPVETFTPHTFAEPTPEGMPAELTRPTCDSAAGYVFDYTSMGCVYVGDANLGQGMGGNYVAPCNVDPALDVTGNNRPEYPSCADVAAANGF